MDGFDCSSGAITPSPSEECPAGHYCPLGVKTPCPIGTFLTTPGAHSVADCIPCTAGYYCDSLGMDFDPQTLGQGETLKCKAGYFCFSGASQYEPIDDISVPPLFGICPVGHYCPEDGTAEPIQCPDGYYQDTTGQTECSDQCPEGYICSGVKISYNSTDECPAGYYCPNDGTTWNSIEPCPLGTYRDVGMNTPASNPDDCEVRFRYH